MNSIRKWIFRPKRSDTAYLAQFYYADEELNLIASELDSFDGRKDPDRCATLVIKLRRSQDNVLGIVEKIMEELIANHRASRDYRVKFPDDVLQESLAGQLWFGAECLAAGSSILNHEVESASMRPLAKTLTRHLDQLRSMLREQCLKNQNIYTEMILQGLIEFDNLFAEFELSYVSAMVPVKTMREHDLLQEVMVLFCETVQRALRLGLLIQDQLDAYDPALMFTIPRLAIVCGLLVYPEGPLNPDMDPLNMSEMFRPFQTLLFKIRELLWTLSREELWLLEKSLCSTDEMSSLHKELSLNMRRQPTDQPLFSPGSDDEEEDDDEEEEEEGENIIDAFVSDSVMVHSESTMTVVPSCHNDDDNSNVERRKVERSTTATEHDSTFLSEVDARRLQHSKSWPKSTARSLHLSRHQRARNSAASAATNHLSESSDNNVTFESRTRATCNSREFNFHLPYNTSSQEDVTPVSFEVDLNSVNDHEPFSKAMRPGVIYFTQSDDETENTDTTHQVSFITDTFCQLFTPNTAIGNSFIRLKNGTDWSDTEIFSDNSTQLNANNYQFGVDRIENTDCSHSDERTPMEHCLHDHTSRSSSLMVVNDTTVGCQNDLAAACLSMDDIRYQSDLPLFGDTRCQNELGVDAEPSFSSCHNENQRLTCTTSVGNYSRIAEEDEDWSEQSRSSSEASVKSIHSDCDEDIIISVSQTENSNEGGTEKTLTVEDNSLTTKNCSTTSQAVENRVIRLPMNEEVDFKKQTSEQINKTTCHLHKSRVRGRFERKVIGKRKCYTRTVRDEMYSGETALPRTTTVNDKRESMRCDSTNFDSSNVASLDYDWDRESYCSSETSSYTSENHDDEEIAMAIQAAEMAARNEARSRFKSSNDLIHRLFVCISGVADQLQTNYASDLRHILKSVFESNVSDVLESCDITKQEQEALTENHANDVNEDMDSPDSGNPPSTSGMENRVAASQGNVISSSQQRNDDSDSTEPPQWIPDEESTQCMACKVAFTFVRRRHHCRNCGKLFCGHCSSNSVPLPQYGHSKPVRVCNYCYMFHVTPFTIH